MEEVQHIWLTASGGPFFKTPQSEFASITVQQALNHPTWKMGKRITIDSATLMNKGLKSSRRAAYSMYPPSRVEVIGTRNLRFIPWSSSWMAAYLLSFPDGYAPSYSVRAYLPGTDSLRPSFPGHELTSAGLLPPDMRKFKCLGLAYEAAEAGGAKP